MRTNRGLVPAAGELSGDRLLSVRAVAERLSLGERSVWKRLAAAALPRPVRIGRSVRWRESDIAAFIEVGCCMQRFEKLTKGVRG